MIKKKGIGITALCMAAVLMVSFTGCGNSKTKSEGTYVKVKEDNIDLKGRIIKVDTASESLVPKEDDSSITSEKQKKVNKVMLARQKEVESKFNCKIEWKVLQQNDMKQLYKNMKAGKYDSDIVYLSAFYNGINMLNENLIAPIDEYIDFDSGIYSSGQELSLWKGKHYGINFANLQIGQYLSYNKTMILNEGLPDPYELMKQGQWTWDAFLDIAKKTTKDTNGDNVTDIWGMEGTYPYVYSGLLYSNGGDYIAEDGGQFKLCLDLPEAKEALNFVTDLYKTNKVVYDALIEHSNSDKDSNGKTVPLFKQGKSAFCINDYGVDGQFEKARVCYPKGPKASGYTAFQTAGNFYAIPAGVKDVKSVAVLMANLFSYFDNTKEEFLTYEDVGLDELYPSELKDIIQKNLKYTWFVFDSYYSDQLFGIYLNMLKQNKSVDEALDSGKASINNSINTLNQAAAQ